MTNVNLLHGAEVLTQLRQESDKPILIKFVAPHCPSCETLAPILEQLKLDRADDFELVSIDMTEDVEVAIEFKVRSAPTVVLLKGNEVKEKVAGLKPKKFYEDLIS